MTAPVLDVDNLRVLLPGRDGTKLPAVDGISFAVAPGEIVGVAGESGSGKTMTALALFGLLGDVAPLDDELAFDAFSAASAFAATQLDLLATVESWLAGQGVPAPDARAYVGVLLRGLSDALTEEPDRELVALADDHATPGGLNQQVREQVRGHGVHEVVATALDDVAARVVRGPGG